MYYCGNCGKSLEKSEIICGRCGYNRSSKMLEKEHELERKLEVDKYKASAFPVFSVRGRISRLQYLIMYIYLFAGIFFTGFGFEGANFHEQPTKGIMSVIGILLFISLCIIWFIASVKRFHDLDLSGFYALLLFIPLVIFFYINKLFFEESSHAENQYEKEGKAYYWQMALVMVMLPAAYGILLQI